MSSTTNRAKSLGRNATLAFLGVDSKAKSVGRRSSFFDQEDLADDSSISLSDKPSMRAPLDREAFLAQPRWLQDVFLTVRADQKVFSTKFLIHILVLISSGWYFRECDKSGLSTRTTRHKGGIRRYPG